MTYYHKRLIEISASFIDALYLSTINPETCLSDCGGSNNYVFKNLRKK